MPNEDCALDRDAVKEQIVSNERGVPHRDPVIASDARQAERDWNTLVRSTERSAPRLTRAAEDAIKTIRESVHKEFAEAKAIEMASLAQRRELLDSAPGSREAAALISRHDQAVDGFRSTLMLRNNEAREDARHWAQRGATPWSREPAPAPRTEFHSEAAYGHVAAQGDRIRDYMAARARDAGAPLPAHFAPQHGPAVYQDRNGGFAAVIKPGEQGDMRVQLQNGDTVNAHYNTDEAGHVTWKAQINKGVVEASAKALTATGTTLQVDLERPLARDSTTDQQSTKETENRHWTLGGAAGGEAHGGAGGSLGGAARNGSSRSVDSDRAGIQAQLGGSVHLEANASRGKDVERSEEQKHVKSSEGPQLREKVGLTFRVDWSEQPKHKDTIEIMRGGR